jgi:hypothetical protein
MTVLGFLDVFGLPAGVERFEDLAANATNFDLGDGSFSPTATSTI